MTGPHRSDPHASGPDPSDPVRSEADGPRLRRPESVLVVVYSRNLECLLLERVSPPDFWQSITGALNWGERAAAAAARELREETGLGPERLRDAGIAQSFPILPAWRAKYAADTEINTEHLWYLELDRIVPITIEPREHRAYRWVPLDQAVDTVASSTNRDALLRLKG